MKTGVGRAGACAIRLATLAARITARRLTRLMRHILTKVRLSFVEHRDEHLYELLGSDRLDDVPQISGRQCAVSIRRARVRLMLEHAGEHADVRTVVRRSGIVARLDALAAAGRVRLRRHEVRDDEPSPLKKTVHELTLEFLDPWDDDYETCPDVA